MKYLSVITIKKVIELAKLEYEASEKLDQKNGTITLDKVPDLPKEYYDLLYFIHNLSNEEIAELATIMLIGRGDYDLEMYDQQILHHLGDPNCAEYIASKKMLATYLEKGFDILSKE
jgi:hypothetical protein